MTCTFEEDVAAYAGAGWGAMEVWLTKLETHLESHSAEDTRKLLEDKQIRLTAGSYQGGLLLSQGKQRRAYFEQFQRRLELCHFFHIPTLLIVPDFAAQLDQTSLERSIASLREAAQWAAGAGVHLALEFQSKAGFCSSLDTAVALVMACGEPNVGICFDVFHYYTGPSKFDDLMLLAKDRLAFVQLSDLLSMPRELASDADRILPGDGAFRLGPILQHFRKLGYDGYVSLELMNPTLWKTKASQVAELGMMAMKRLLGEKGA